MGRGWRGPRSVCTRVGRRPWGPLHPAPPPRPVPPRAGNGFVGEAKLNSPTLFDSGPPTSPSPTSVGGRGTDTGTNSPFASSDSLDPPAGETGLLGGRRQGKDTGHHDRTPAGGAPEVTSDLRPRPHVGPSRSHGDWDGPDTQSKGVPTSARTDAGLGHQGRRERGSRQLPKRVDDLAVDGGHDRRRRGGPAGAGAQDRGA